MHRRMFVSLGALAALLTGGAAVARQIPTGTRLGGWSHSPLPEGGVDVDGLAAGEAVEKPMVVAGNSSSNSSSNSNSNSSNNSNSNSSSNSNSNSSRGRRGRGRGRRGGRRR